jgi:methionyl-tRNA formyltransferase
VKLIALVVHKDSRSGENCGVTQLRLVFAGSPEAAVPSLDALVAGRHKVVAVVTRNDSPKGRRSIQTPTPVAETAERHRIPIIKTNALDKSASEAITALAPDLGVIVAYGGLVREPLLSAPRYGWINLHFSLLPRWRGAAPVQHAIIAGDDLTGASVFQLVPELDAGDVFGVLTQSVNSTGTAGTLLESLAHSGASLLTSVVDAISDGTARADAQRGDVTLAPKLEFADGVIDWYSDSLVIYNKIRGVTPEPGASTILDGVRLKIIEARTSSDVAASSELSTLEPGRFSCVKAQVFVGTGTVPLELIRVHPAGRKVMAASDWWRGRPANAATLAEPAIVGAAKSDVVAKLRHSQGAVDEVAL